MKDREQVPVPSVALMEWLERREDAIRCGAAIRRNGGHVMFNQFVVDPMELPEEAIEYLRFQRKGANCDS